jgi:hypothetical protein
MNLSSPISITPPSYTRANGEVRTFSPIIYNDLDITIVDNPKQKSVRVYVQHCPRPLILWENDTYTSAGDYTQAQVETRIVELLGNDPKRVLENLFLPPSK